MKDESLSKFYVAVARTKYTADFVYKTKKIPSEDIGEMWSNQENRVRKQLKKSCETHAINSLQILYKELALTP